MTTTKVISDLDRLLKPLGFSRRKFTWNREVERFVDVLDVQISKAEDAMTLNVGVLERDIYATCWPQEAGEFIDEPACTVRARVGELIDGKDRWWPIDKTSAADEMRTAVLEFVIPFLQRMHSLEDMAQWLRTTNVEGKKYPPPIICLAILEHRVGQQAKACSILAELEQKAVDGWKLRVQEVSKKIGCD
jgi:hypothetical protein